MTARVLISGTLFREPEQRTSKTGEPFVTATIRAKYGDTPVLDAADWRKHHAIPCHHALAEALHAYIDAAGIAEDHKGWLFRTSCGHAATALS